MSAMVAFSILISAAKTRGRANEADGEQGQEELAFHGGGKNSGQ